MRIIIVSDRTHYNTTFINNTALSISVIKMNTEERYEKFIETVRTLDENTQDIISSVILRDQAYIYDYDNADYVKKSDNCTFLVAYVKHRNFRSIVVFRDSKIAKLTLYFNQTRYLRRLRREARNCFHTHTFQQSINRLSKFLDEIE